MTRCNCTLPYRHITRTRIVWAAVFTYLLAFGVGFVIGRLLHQPIFSSLVLGGVFDAGVVPFVGKTAGTEKDWSRSGSWRW